MTLVVGQVVPTLRELGVMDDAVFNTIFVEKPDAVSVVRGPTSRPRSVSIHGILQRIELRVAHALRLFSASRAQLFAWCRSLCIACLAALCG